MTLFKEIFIWIVILGLVPILLLTLWVIVRCSFISERRLRGEEQRLRLPEPEGVAGFIGIQLPAELIEFYRLSEVIERTEFYLVDNSKTLPQGWYISRFIPLTVLDTKEHRAISNVPGLPIATDSDGGYYYLDTKDLCILLQISGKTEKPILVAPSAAEFILYKPLLMPAEEK